MDQLTSEPHVAPQSHADYSPPTAEELKNAILAKLVYSIGKDLVAASQRDWFLAVAFATRDRIVDRWIEFDPRRLTPTTASASITSRSSS